VKTFLVGELFAPFRVFELDEACTLLQTRSTAFAGATHTGIASPNTGAGSVYWVVDLQAAAIFEFDFGVGTATGVSVTIPPARASGARW